MIYILFGKQDLMIKKRLNKIINEFFVDDEYKNVIKYDLVQDSIYKVIDECNQLSLQSNKKVVICYNSTFLKDSKKDKNNSKEFEELKRYINNENEDICLAFVLYDDSISDKNDIVNLIKDKGNILEFQEIKKYEWPKYIELYLKKKNIKIDNDALNELALRTNADLNVFTNEVEKLILYTNGNIKLSDVKNIVTKKIEDNVFDILNYLIENNKSKALSVYRDLRLNNIEPVTLLNIFTNSLIFLDEVLYLFNSGLNANDISKNLNANIYRVNMSLKNLKYLNFGKIKNKLEDLYNLDYKIKHNKIDRFYGFELFIINF